MTSAEITEATTIITYRAGAPWRAGTTMPTNVTGECPHQHKTAEAAQACIDRLDRSIKRGHGRSAYADRVVMAEERYAGVSGVQRRWVVR